MPALVQDKYQLRTLHEEIDLFDRKLAYVLRFQEFTSDADRAAELKRLTSKRELLARAARQMAHSGIEYKASELPRSFRAEQGAAAAEGVVVTTPDEAPATVRKASKARVASPYAGTSLDFQKGLQEYKRKKKAKGLSPEPNGAHVTEQAAPPK
jgi:hypothetical protein